MAKADLTPARLRELFDYDRDAGVFRRRKSHALVPAGEPAGADHKGYRKMMVDKTTYRVHHLVWFIERGEWAAGEIDHIDGDKANNRIGNLRVVSRSINMQNQRRARSNSRSGLLGVMVNGKRWTAQINLGNGVRKGLGTYDTPAEAHAVYLEAKRQLHEGSTL